MNIIHKVFYKYSQNFIKIERKWEKSALQIITPLQLNMKLSLCYNQGYKTSMFKCGLFDVPIIIFWITWRSSINVINAFQQSHLTLSNLISEIIYVTLQVTEKYT